MSVSKGKKLNPVVVLNDIGSRLNRNHKRSFSEMEESSKSLENMTESNLQNGWDSSKSETEVPGMLTPRSTPSPALSSSKSEEPPRKKVRNCDKEWEEIWDTEAEYEIEKIVGYHIEDGDLNKMTYFVKWKGWSPDFNTYEPIENMTGCNQLLCEYFEEVKPKKSELEAMMKEVEDDLKNYEIYNKLKEFNFSKMVLDEFSEDYLDISDIFSENFKQFEAETEKQYNFIIRTLIGMYDHRDPGMFKRAKNYAIALLLCRKRKEQLEALKETEKRINELEKCEIRVENFVDFDLFADDYTYGVEPLAGEGVIIPSDPPYGCTCKGGCNAKSSCCSKEASASFAYDTRGKLTLPDQSAIYECNSKCACDSKCRNRVVQHGRKVKLAIFKTKKVGWGVKALERIPKGTFVCEYIGEIIKDAVANVRDIDYVRRNIAYLFDLDFNTDAHPDDMCVIDATVYGNVARFINHSCEPNLSVFPVYIECLDPNLPRLAFFAKKQINANEEIHFNYENIPEGEEHNNDSSRVGARTICKIRCYCGSSKCRQWVFGSGN